MIFIRRHTVNLRHIIRAEVHCRTQSSWSASMTSEGLSRSSCPRARDRHQATPLDADVVCHAEQGINSSIALYCSSQIESDDPLRRG